MFTQFSANKKKGAAVKGKEKGATVNTFDR
jgi:hypothetical protein